MSWVGPAIQAGGSILGGIAGGKGSKGNKPPKWLRQQTRDLASFGQQLGQTQYDPYQGDRVAPFSQDTLNAFDLIRNNIGSTQPYYASALDTANRLQNTTINPQMVNGTNVQTQFDPRLANANQWAGQDLSPYMNPYTQSVIDTQMADQQNAYLMADNALKSQGAAANAFGNNRFGLAQGQLAADAVRDQALTSAQLRSQGFNIAAGLLSQDVDRQNQFALANQMAGITADQMGFQGQLANQANAMQASLANQSADLQGQMSTADIQNRNAFLSGVLGQNLAAQNTADAQALAGAGAAQQALAQQNLDVGYSDYMDQRNWPTQQLNWWNSALQPGVAVGSAMAGAPASQGGGLLGALGGAQLGSQVGSSIYDWWKGMNTVNPYANGGSYDSYSQWDY